MKLNGSWKMKLNGSWVISTVSTALLLSFLGACDSPKAAKRVEPASRTTAASTRAVQKREQEGAKTTGSAQVHVFDRAVRPKACEVLTPRLVSQAFEIPEKELTQIKLAGCLYTWEKDGKELQARLGSIHVMKSPLDAMRWFENATRGSGGKSKRPRLSEVIRHVEHKLDEQADKDSGKLIATKGAQQSGEDSVQFQDVPGLGDEARIQLDNGVIWVRVGNLGFNVAAYLGKSAPPQKQEEGSIKEALQEAQKNSQKWDALIFEQRKEQGTKLGKLVIELFLAM